MAKRLRLPSPCLYPGPAVPPMRKALSPHCLVFQMRL